MRKAIFVLSLLVCGFSNEPQEEFDTDVLPVDESEFDNGNYEWTPSEEEAGSESTGSEEETESFPADHPSLYEYRDEGEPGSDEDYYREDYF